MADGDAHREVGGTIESVVARKRVSKAAVASVVLACLCLAVLALSRVDAVRPWGQTVDSFLDRLARTPGLTWASTFTRKCIIVVLGLVVPLLAAELAVLGMADVLHRQARGRAWCVAGFLLGMFCWGIVLLDFFGAPFREL